VDLGGKLVVGDDERASEFGEWKGWAECTHVGLRCEGEGGGFRSDGGRK
jgi:hypothetical protein